MWVFASLLQAEHRDPSQRRMFSLVAQIETRDTRRAPGPRREDAGSPLDAGLRPRELGRSFHLY